MKPHNRASVRPKKDSLFGWDHKKQNQAIPELMTQREFACYMKVSAQQIAKRKDRGRLVMVNRRPRPLVDVRESLELIRATTNLAYYFHRPKPPWWLAECSWEAIYLSWSRTR